MDLFSYDRSHFKWMTKDVATEEKVVSCDGLMRSTCSWWCRTPADRDLLGCGKSQSLLRGKNACLM